MAEQLIFDLPVRQALGRDAFFVSPSNAVAMATLDAVDNWPSGKLVLIGPKGAGKTHMAHVWASDHAAVIVPAQTLAQADIPALAARRFVVVEDADRLSSLPDPQHAEEALFHLHNLTLAEGGRLLLTAQSAPNHWTLGLPDLASRMQGTTVARIEPPDDKLLAAMLVKQFDDRQIAVPGTLILWLVKRMERSAEAARRMVETLDAAALRSGRPISRNLAAQFFPKDE
ncbi:DnaA ATPase domain-containing protein [Celeribacter ethanolicus]|uniref:Chromosomal replication initiator DnaA n=1 Tax=Celeribacter ethanolicus TaxID=1758178 RepID=A0A291GH49_9RHOB|nr:DnaA/Hda family protein [Celeribacter ethanolicus]ATG49525.1 chromosomal replication initiator DnaA [Celeribacter ethanolicus]TNE68250.1 MAG: chromosomal replication initiator DnaA [Paracoccaceae bacterium]